MEPHSHDVGPAFFEEMVETVGVGVGIYRSDGEYIYANDAYADLFGVTPEAILDTPLWEIVPEIEAERFARYWASFDAGETRMAETEHEIDGATVPVATVTTRRLIDGTPYHFGTIRDISPQRERERELKRQNERLDAFAGVVSHDLRNPLNVAQGYLDLLEEDVDRDELTLVEGALDRMELLIDDLLSLARSGETIDEPEPVSVAETAVAGWETVETESAALHVQVEDPLIRADEQRLRQLLENLFRNAIEHGGQDVTVTVGPLTDGFYVEDSGDGIAPDEREKVFEPSYTTVDGGTGFGLGIVKQVVEAHTWDIQATEGSDGGARFEITGVNSSE